MDSIMMLAYHMSVTMRKLAVVFEGSKMNASQLYIAIYKGYSINCLQIMLCGLHHKNCIILFI
uniref:Uncharacterized protein n=1 Tax=Octopus bimaculoides TaxID=37653 RepID=A0A0L8GAZ2_OCTBM